MSTVTLNPRSTAPAHGATAATGHPRTRRFGGTLRAVKVYARAAFGVIVMGEYAEEVGVHTRSHTRTGAGTH
ncbi:hypothetical protein [Streptomyces sp. NPDC052042]|uniref:hypothetical protein n=1 Tax=Streptomyces sp. NPDC052042 TaxID=3365683 RepID=UPI0037CFA993